MGLKMVSIAVKTEETPQDEGSTPSSSTNSRKRTESFIHDSYQCKTTIKIINGKNK